MSEFGSDPPIIDLLGLKNQQSQGIVDPQVQPLQKVSDNSRIQLFAELFYDKSRVKTNTEIERSECCNAILLNNVCTNCEKVFETV